MILNLTIQLTRTNLTALRWPRSSGGSFRSLTESITPDKRCSVLFDFDVEEEARLRPATQSVEDISALDLKTTDDETALASRLAMSLRHAKFWD